MHNGAVLASEPETQLNTRGTVTGMTTSRLDTRKNSTHVPAPFSAGPAIGPSGVATTHSCCPSIPELEAHPHSAGRGGCTSTNSIPLAAMSSKQAFSQMGFETLLRKGFHCFFSLPNISTPKPHKCNVVDQPIPCKLHRRGVQMVSPILLPSGLPSLSTD